MAKRQPAGRKPAANAKERKARQPDRRKQAAFLAAYVKTGNLSAAARAAKIERNTHYRWVEEDAGDPDGDPPVAPYKDRFKEAKVEAIELLESEARRRAVEGVEEPVGWYQGEAGGTVRRYSDTLLIFLLKAAKPEKYRERFESKHTGQIEVGGQVTFYLPQNGRPNQPDEPAGGPPE